MSVALLVVQREVAAEFCYTNVGSSTTPTVDFVLNANGTATHTQTGLIWKRCNEGLSGADCAFGSPVFTDWSGALSVATASTFAGYTDWRVPTKKELESITDDVCILNETVFPNPLWTEPTWTSTTVASQPQSAWYVWGIESSAYEKNYTTGVVRLVRSGQSFDALAALAAQTLTFGAAPVGVVVGGTATVAATSSSPNSGNAVSYSSLTPAVCSVNASTGTVTALADGTCTIAANQAGNANYASAAQVTQSFAISAAVPTAVPALDRQALLALVLSLGVAGSMRLRLRRQS